MPAKYQPVRSLTLILLLLLILLPACSQPTPAPIVITPQANDDQTIGRVAASPLPTHPSVPILLPTETPATLPTPNPTPTPLPSAVPTQAPTSVSAYQAAFGIDYSRPDQYLLQGEQTRISDPSVADGLRMEQQNFPQAQFPMLGKIHFWMRDGFSAYSAGGRTIGAITVDQLLSSRRLAGCHDWGLVYAALARQLGYPAVMIDTLSLAWAKQFQAGQSQGYTGHVFVEVYVDGKWVLVDSTNNWYVLDGYDPANPIIPLKGGIAGKEDETYGFYVMRKGLDTWDIDIYNVRTLNQLMETTAWQIDLSSLVYPPYQVEYISTQE